MSALLLHLPRIKARRCLKERAEWYCTRATGHTGRHAATTGPCRVVMAVWS